MIKFFEKTQIWKMAILYITANILNYVIALQLNKTFNLENGVGNEIVNALLFAIIILWFSFAVIKDNIRIDSEFKNLKRDTNIKECAAVIVFNYSVSIAMVLVLLLAVTKLFPPELINKLTSEAIQPTGFIGAVIGLITTSILAPVAEELLFRGVLFTQMKKRMGVGAAIFISSMLFGLTHMSLAMIRSAIFGACMCILFLKTKNILVPIVVHMVYNFLLTMLGSYKVLFGIEASSQTVLVLNATTTIIQIVVSVAVIIISAIYLKRKFNFFDLKPYNAIKQNQV